MTQSILTKKWITYHKMKKMKESGVSVSEIARKTNHSRSTVYKYLSMTKEEFLDFLESQATRKKKLEDFESEVLDLIVKNKSSKEIYDYLTTNFEELNIVEQTVINFVEYVRKKNNLM